MNIQESLVLIKPDAVARGLCGEIIKRIEAKGYSIIDMHMKQATREMLEMHYKEHAGKDFYKPLLDFMESGPLVALRIAGERVIEGFRSIAGSTDPTTAAAGTVRGDFGREWGFPVIHNLVHGSDSADSAKREIAIWFTH